jgi:hypothetical protein
MTIDQQAFEADRRAESRHAEWWDRHNADERYSDAVSRWQTSSISQDTIRWRLFLERLASIAALPSPRYPVIIGWGVNPVGWSHAEQGTHPCYLTAAASESGSVWSRNAYDALWMSEPNAKALVRDFRQPLCGAQIIALSNPSSGADSIDVSEHSYFGASIPW